MPPSIRESLARHNGRLPSRASATAAGVIALSIVVLAVSFKVADNGPGTNGGTASFTPTAPVLSGPFDIEVTESATLDARQSVTLSSDLPSNRAKILYLAEEGAFVRQGDVVARFDPSPFEEDISKLESDIQEARAVLQQGQAEVALLEAESETARNKLAQQYDTARTRLENLQSADIPIRISKAETDLARAQADYSTARQETATEEKLLASGLANKTDVEKARIMEKEKRIALDIARRNYDNLKDTALPSELRQARLAVEHSGKELENQETVIRQQSLIRENANIARYRSKLADLEQALAQARNHRERTTLRAPVSGQLLYMKISIANEKRRVQVGDSLWNLQPFAVIPDMSSLVARINVRESDIGKLEPGQRATLYPEAYPNLSLPGHLESIGTLASVAEGQNASVFEVRIALDGADKRLRPGMSARAVILARHFDQALRVPVEAMFYLDRQAVCFLWNGGDPREVPVVPGDSDGRFIVIESGLEEGQQVMLVFPESFDRPEGAGSR